MIFEPRQKNKIRGYELIASLIDNLRTTLYHINNELAAQVLDCYVPDSRFKYFVIRVHSQLKS